MSQPDIQANIATLDRIEAYLDFLELMAQSHPVTPESVAQLVEEKRTVLSHLDELCGGK